MSPTNHQIILIGKDISSVYHGIKEFAPDHIHLLYTSETKDIPEPMFPLLSPSIKISKYLVDAYEGASVIRVCKQIHSRYKGNFTYNISEGTKLMAFAASYVAWQFQANIFYITQHSERVNCKTFYKELMVTKLSNQEIIQLNGNHLAKYQDIKELKASDIKDSFQIKNFIETYPLEHTRLQKFFGIYCNKRLERLPVSHLFGNNLRFKQRNGRMIVILRGRLLLKLDSSAGVQLFFCGRWWETLIAYFVKQWCDTQTAAPEAWQNVIFRTETPMKQTKNEIDVLLNNEQKLIFLECKSGAVTQNDIYKIDAVRETYGGDISQAVLASYYPIDTALAEKCKDLNIHVFAPQSNEERIHYIETLPKWLENIVNKTEI